MRGLKIVKKAKKPIQIAVCTMFGHCYYKTIKGK